ncbi:MAG: cytochrome c peroxidase [Pseudomonadota bacterium]
MPEWNISFPEVNARQVELGRLLFYDPILSGNKEVACATCHHPKHATADGLSLGIGDGGIGLGPERVADPDNPPPRLIPRNAPALFNLGAAEVTTFFHDGRLEVLPDGTVRTPLGAQMERGLASLLSAQTMFAVLSPDEMAGHGAENEISAAVQRGAITGPGGAWDLLSQRVAAIPQYRARFDDVIGPEPIHFTDISNAIAAFVDFEWRAVNSPFDAYLRRGVALPEEAARGMDLFYGDAGCARCHSGILQTDHRFHAIAMPQVGLGKAARFDSFARDEGRKRVTGRREDAYAFRTPSLRNVVHTAPYGHAGAYATLEGAIRHHLDPVAALMSYDARQLVLPRVPGQGFLIVSDPAEVDAIAGANTLLPRNLTDRQVADIIAFLGALTDPFSLAGALGEPETVPSGLNVPQ